MNALFDNFRLAFGTFFQNPLRSLLTLLGIVIGVATVVSMMALIEGLRLKVTADMAALGANGFQVQKLPQGFGGFDFEKLSKRPNLTLEDLRAIQEGAPLVVAAAGEDFQGGQKLSTAAHETRSNVFLWAGTPEYFATNGVTVTLGRPFSEREYLDSARVVVLGADLAEVLFPGMNPLGQTVRLKGHGFQVIGVLPRKGGSFGDNQDNTLMMPMTVMNQIYGRGRSLNISMQAASSQELPRAQDQVVSLLRRRRHLKPSEPDNFFIFSNESATQMFNNISSVVTAASFGVCILSLIVGGIGILNIMLVSVTERTREIGLRKALGAKRRRILAQFATEAVALSLFGGFLGVIIGWGFSGLGHWVLAVPTHVPAWAISVSLGMSSAVGLGFGIYPAARAAKLDPVEAMRVD